MRRKYVKKGGSMEAVLAPLMLLLVVLITYKVLFKKDPKKKLNQTTQSMKK